MKKRGCLIAVLAVAGFIALALSLLDVGMPRYRAHCRVKWKNRVLAEIRRDAADQAWVAGHMAAMKEGKGHTNPRFCYREWLSERMVLMANGEWLVYAAQCSKADWRIDDIFIACGSNRRWYYSTCHFCVGMSVLVMEQEQQPHDLATFARNWRLAEFDGESVDCLKETEMSPDWDEIEGASKAAATDALPRPPEQ